MSSIELFWFERLKEGTILSGQNEFFKTRSFGSHKKLIKCRHATNQLIEKYQSEWPDNVVTAILHEDFINFCKNSRRRDKLVLNHFSRNMRKLIPGISGDTRIMLETGRAGVLELPSLSDCRKYFAKIMQYKIDWSFDEIENSEANEENYPDEDSDEGGESVLTDDDFEEESPERR